MVSVGIELVDKFLGHKLLPAHSHTLTLVEEETEPTVMVSRGTRSYSPPMTCLARARTGSVDRDVVGVLEVREGVEQETP